MRIDEEMIRAKPLWDELCYEPLSNTALTFVAISSSETGLQTVYSWVDHAVVDRLARVAGGEGP